MMQQRKKAKKKGKCAALELVNEDFIEHKQIKAQELERLEKLAMLQEESNQRRKEATRRQEEANQFMKKTTRTKKINMWLKLSEKEHLNDQSKERFQNELFGNKLCSQVGCQYHVTLCLFVSSLYVLIMLICHVLF